jgi:hypothetical protein
MLLLFSCCSSAREGRPLMSLCNVRGQMARVAAVAVKGQEDRMLRRAPALKRFLWLVDAN